MISLRGLTLRCPREVCLSDVPKWSTSEVSLRGVSQLCPQEVSLRGVSERCPWDCVSVMSLGGLSQ